MPPTQPSFCGQGFTEGSTMDDVNDTNQSLFDRAVEVLPGGVNSPVRAFGAVGGSPYFVAGADGARVIDVEGRTFIDYVQSYGASILGHANPAVVAAVREAAIQGTTFGAPTRAEVELAELVCSWVPGLEMIRMTSSGTEATMSALRLARGATGRDIVVKFAGCYHGHADALLAEGGSGVANQGLVGSAGVPDSAVADTIVAPYNVVPELDETVAAVIVEPVAANMGLVTPEPGFLQALRAECDRVGALLLFDEVITGFRLGEGGATAWSGVTPDLWAFGKVIGGGLPVGAFGGSLDVMSQVAPLGPVYQGGTLSGNPLATAAGLAALGQLSEDSYAELAAKSERLAIGMRGAFADAGVEVRVPRVGPLVGLFFGDNTPRNYDEAKQSVSSGQYPPFFWGMLERGVAFAPGAYEAIFPSLAHTDADIDATIEAVASTASDMASNDRPS